MTLSGDRTSAPITAGAHDGAPPLSFAQQRLWFLDQLEGAGEAYHIPSGLRLKGALDRAALRRALDRIVARHEALRTTFVVTDGQPAQQIGAADQGLALVEHDLRGVADGEAELRRLAAQEARAPFDLERGPLIRGRLVQLADDEHVLLVTMHHIVSDGWSMGVLTNELSALYAAFSQGRGDPLPPLAVQYADYAVWQRRWVAGEVLQRQADYWKATLAGAPAILTLPTDRPRPAQQDYAGAAAVVRLSAELTGALKALSLRRGATLHMTLLTAWAALLGRLSGQDEVVIGSPAANRTRSEIEGLIGFFVNTLALRIDVSGSPSLAALVERTKAASLAAQEHQDLPFEQVVEVVQPPRSLSQAAVFQAMFAWQNAPQGRLELPGLTLSVLESGQAAAKFDLTLSLGEAGGEIGGSLAYATALFDADTIERWLGYWVRLLEAMVADESQAADAVALLGEAERRRVLVDWNATAAAYPAEQCLHELFEAQAAQTPQAPAVVYEDRALTYAELNAQANRLAHHLRGLGVKPDERVAICVERSVEMVIGLLAVLKAGGAYVPLDPAYPAERLAYMLQDSRPVALLTDGGSRALIDGCTGGLAVLDVAQDADRWAAQPETNPDRGVIGVRPSHLAYVIYTSGSTGKPKGVMVEHAAVVNLWQALEASAFAGCPAGLKVSLNAGISFDASVQSIVQLLSGRCLVVVPQDCRLDPGQLLKFLARHQIDVLDCTPAQLAMLLAEGLGEGVVAPRIGLVGGDAISVEAWDRIARLTASHFYNVYGPTECTVDATIAAIDSAAAAPTIGRPLGNVRIYLLDAHGAPVPIGVAGEIHIGGAGVARGYLDRPELTAERFIASPFVAGDRLYKTGDLGRYLPDGNIEFLGRNDFQVKIRGFRIELGEIEARLAEHAAVREAVVVARADSPGDQRLAAYYVGDADVGAEALRSHLVARLPDHMVPAAYVRLDALPLTPNGKLDRRALPAPEDGAYATRGYEPPQGETEQALAGIWSELLKIERVGRHDNFFELGGHSLLAVTLVEHMRRHGLRIDVRALFNAPTFAGLAAAAGRSDGGVEVEVPPNLIPPGCRAITPDMLPLIDLSQAEIDVISASVPGGAPNIQDVYPLAPLQQGVLFHHLMAREGDIYLTSALLAFDRRGRLDGFVTALQAVIGRHDILRTAVVWEGLSQPAQVVWREAALPVEEVELDPAGGEAAEQLRARFDARRFRIDLGQAPLLRAFVAHDADNDRWLLLLLHHHLVMDHTTLDVLVGEVEAHLVGRTDRLPAPAPFRNFVAQARLGVSEAEHEAFFRGMLGEVDEPVAPFGLLDVQGDAELEEARLALAPELAERLRGRARALGVSAASLFHLAWGLVVARTSGASAAVFGTVLFGRMQGGSDADRTVGMFINTLPIRVEVGMEGVEASVRRVQALLAELLRHEHASLALAQRCSGVPAPAPLFTALLNYRHSHPGEAGRSIAWEGVDVLGAKERTNYPVTLSVDDLGEGFELTAQTLQSVGAERLCGFMRTALEGLADALERAPETPVRDIDMLDAAERRRLLVDWNAKAAAYLADRCLHELFEAQAARAPEAVAVAHEDRALTYAELNAQANRLAHHLRGLGVKPDERVAICVERSVEMVVGLLAILKAGGAYVPLDPAYPAERLAYMLKDSAPAAVLTHAAARAVLEAATEELEERPPLVDLAADAAEWEHLADTDITARSLGLSAQNCAYVIYTSGSTGVPKGVMVEHRNVVRLFSSTAKYFHFDENDVWTLFHSFAFDFSVWEIWGALAHGGRLIVVPALTARTPAEFYNLVCAKGVTVLNQTPSAFRNLSAAQAESGGEHRLRAVIFGGEALEVSSLKPWFDEPRNKHAHLVNMYGITETTVHVTYRPLDRNDVERAGSSPVGRPIEDLRVYILDGRLEPAPTGVAGEIYVGGAGVARGYLNRRELTAERFVADPFVDEPGARMYRTGDLGRYLPNGDIEFLGRNDFQVKIRGFRIELGEIEARLGEHAAVREAVVMARADSPGDPRLAAYYVADADVGAEALRSHLAARLPDHMVPAAYVRLDALPLTPNGKLDRRALPAPEDGAFATRGYEPPQGETEEALEAIWSELLGVERVGRHDNFFELGGHSLRAVQLVGACKRHGLDISLAQLFAHPTLEALAHQGAAKADAPLRPGVVALRTEGKQSPLFLVPEVTGQVLPYSPRLTRHIDPDIPVYGLTSEPEVEPALRTLQGMAARLVRDIRSVQPVGPYRLVGWSFGGTLAYEVATQLIGQDETVEFLGLIDTYRRAAKVELPGHDSAYLRQLVTREAERGQAPSTRAHALDAVDPGDFVAMARKCQELSLLPEPFDRFSVEELRDSVLRHRLHSEASRRYEPGPISVPIYLFAAQESGSDDARLGWSAIAPDGQLSIIPVPGDHQSMVEDPHVVHLGAALSSAIGEAGRRRSSQAAGAYAPLAPIQTGRRGVAPLLCVPGAGGSAVGFADFAQALGESWPIYGVQPRGLDGLEVPHSTVPAAARAYLSAFEESCPEGPVHLLGHSFGGWVACEMALRLRAAGREVASLTLVDSEAPGDERAEHTRAEALTKLVDIWEMAASRPLDIDLDQLAALGAAQQLAALHRALVRVGLMPPRSSPDALSGTVRTFEMALRTSYRPEAVYPGLVHLVLLRDVGLDGQAQDREFSERLDGWRTWAPNLDVWRGPGDHMTALKPPHVAALADWVRAKLNAATSAAHGALAGQS